MRFHDCEKQFFSPGFRFSKLVGCNFSHLEWKGAEFTECQLHDCYFQEVKMPQAKFTSCDLQGSLFHHAHLANSDFQGAKNYQIDLRSNDLKKSKFTFPDALSLLQALEIEVSFE